MCLDFFFQQPITIFPYWNRDVCSLYIVSGVKNSVGVIRKLNYLKIEIQTNLLEAAGLVAGRLLSCVAGSTASMLTLDAMLLVLSSFTMVRRTGGTGRAPNPSRCWWPSSCCTLNVTLDVGRLNRWYAVAAAADDLCSSTSRLGTVGGLSLTDGAMYDSIIQLTGIHRRPRSQFGRVRLQLRVVVGQPETAVCCKQPTKKHDDITTFYKHLWIIV